jgi:HNH endonuclease
MSSEITTTQGSKILVVRSSVPPDRQYREYKPWLRNDFFYSCAYCTMSEAEAQAIRFTIDHYEPVKTRPDLIDLYDNLMYCCDECNLRKGDRSPPLDARADGYRFFRPDIDSWLEHFKRKGLLLEPMSNVGSFSIDALDLNRKLLRTLRMLRERLTACDEHIAQGILALRRFPIDRLPQQIKATAVRYISQTINASDELADAIDRILREYARSPLIEVESGPELEKRKRERQARLKKVEALYPGNWRSSRRKSD